MKKKITNSKNNQKKDWFVSIRDSRLEQLEVVFKSNFNYKLHNSTKDLEFIGSILPQTLTYSQKSSEEVVEQRKKLPTKFKDVKIRDYKLTDFTKSFLFDIGIFFGELLRKKNKNLFWNISIRKNVDEGSVVLTNGKFDLNIKMVFEVVGYKVVEQKKVDLVKLFNTWDKLLGK